MLYKDDIKEVLKVANELGYDIIKMPCDEYRIVEYGKVVFRVWSNKKRNWENEYGQLKRCYTDLIVEMIKYRNQYDIIDVLKKAESLDYDWIQVLNNEFHILLNGKVVFRVWVSNKQKWCKGCSNFGNGYRFLIKELELYYSNNKEV